MSVSEILEITGIKKTTLYDSLVSTKNLDGYIKFNN